jgi:hypothetical protein
MTNPFVHFSYLALISAHRASRFALASGSVPISTPFGLQGDEREPLDFDRVFKYVHDFSPF